MLKNSPHQYPKPFIIVQLFPCLTLGLIATMILGSL